MRGVMAEGNAPASAQSKVGNAHSGHDAPGAGRCASRKPRGSVMSARKSEWRGASLIEKQSGGLGVAAFPREVTAQEETADRPGIGVGGCGQTFVSEFQVAPEQRDFAEHQQRAGLFRIAGLGALERSFRGGRIGVGFRENGLDHAPLLPGPMALRVALLEFGEGHQHAHRIALTGEAKAEIIARVFMGGIEFDGLAEQADGFGIVLFPFIAFMAARWVSQNFRRRCFSSLVVPALAGKVPGEPSASAGIAVSARLKPGLRAASRRA